MKMDIVDDCSNRLYFYVFLITDQTQPFSVSINCGPHKYIACIYYNYLQPRNPFNLEIIE